MQQSIDLQGQLPSGAGGQTPGFAVGGVVPGFGGTDSLLARLTPGEGVLNPIGMGLVGSAGLSQLNAGQNPFEGGSSDVVEMAFNFNKKKIGTLRGDRHSAELILENFSNMNRSLS